MPLQKGRQLGFEERADPARTALIVIDVQNDFCHPKGYHGRMGADLSMMPDMKERLTNLVAAARRAQVLIIWVRATYDEIVQGAPLAEILARGGVSPVRCAEGSWGADWFGDLRPVAGAANELVVTKHRYSAFWDTEIDLYLRAAAIESAVICGVITSGCVESTARDAFFLNYRVVLPGDACASYARTRHDNALAKLALTFATVVESEVVIEAWSASRADLLNWHLEAKRARSLDSLPALVDPAHAALIVIDMQNDFCHPDGVMARAQEGLQHNASIVPAIAGLLAAARAAGVIVVHVQAQYGVASGSPASLFRKGRDGIAQEICLPGSWGAAQIDALPVRAGEAVVVKHRLSAFRDTGLELLLRSNGIRTIVVVGTATQACVESTVRDAALRDYYVVVPRDAVAARDRMRAMHDASLLVMEEYFATLASTSEILALWTDAAASTAMAAIAVPAAVHATTAA
jgi:nicotinamidase-related amidase